MALSTGLVGHLGDMIIKILLARLQKPFFHSLSEVGRVPNRVQRWLGWQAQFESHLLVIGAHCGRHLSVVLAALKQH